LDEAESARLCGELDRRLAPLLALGVLAVVGLGVIGFWIAYQLHG